MIDVREIRERLDNLGTIEHLVRSMRAMSAIRWRKARQSLEAVQRYAASVREQLSVAVSYPTPLVRSVGRAPDRPPHRVALIVISSDHGLCGPFNAVLFKTAHAHIDRWREEGREVEVIALGEYARRAFCDKPDMCYLVWTHRFPLTHVVSFIETRDIWRTVEDIYQRENLDELYVIYNYFISFGSYKQRLVRLLPPEIEPAPIAAEERPILGSDAQELQQFLLFEHLALQLYLGLVESMVSEQGARLQAMDAAEANIRDRSAELHRAYHIARQAGITAEMLEIASGAEAVGGMTSV